MCAPFRRKRRHVWIRYEEMGIMGWVFERDSAVHFRVAVRSSNPAGLLVAQYVISSFVQPMSAHSPERNPLAWRFSELDSSNFNCGVSWRPNVLARRPHSVQRSE